MDMNLSNVYHKRITDKRKKLSSMNDELKTLLSEMSKSLDSITEAYTSATGGTTLICKAPLNQFYEEEERYRETLTKFTKTLFTETGDGHDRPALERHRLLLRGLPADPALQRRLRTETVRLREARRTGLEAEINAEVSRARAEAELEELKTSLKKQTSPIVSDKEHQAIVSRVHSLRAHVERLRRQELPTLLDDLCGSSAQRVELLQLNLQDARHQFFIHRQDRLISWLMNQRQWNTLLVMLHETELRNQKILLRLLKRVDDERTALLSKTQEANFDPLADQQLPNLQHAEVQEVLKVFGKERLSASPSEISRQAVEEDATSTKSLRNELEYFEQQVNSLSQRVLPKGMKSDPQLSFPEVHQMLSAVRAQVKTLGQKAAHYSRLQTPALVTTAPRSPSVASSN